MGGGHLLVDRRLQPAAARLLLGEERAAGAGFGGEEEGDVAGMETCRVRAYILPLGTAAARRARIEMIRWGRPSLSGTEGGMCAVYCVFLLDSCNPVSPRLDLERTLLGRVVFAWVPLHRPHRMLRDTARDVLPDCHEFEIASGSFKIIVSTFLTFGLLFQQHYLWIAF